LGEAFLFGTLRRIPAEHVAGDGFGELPRLVLVEAVLSDEPVLKLVGTFFGADSDAVAQVLFERLRPADAALEALRRDPAPADASRLAVFGRAGVVAVEVRRREALEDVKFYFHGSYEEVWLGGWSFSWFRRSSSRVPSGVGRFEWGRPTGAGRAEAAGSPARGRCS